MESKRNLKIIGRVVESSYLLNCRDLRWDLVSLYSQSLLSESEVRKFPSEDFSKVVPKSPLRMLYTGSQNVVIYQVITWEMTERRKGLNLKEEGIV